MTTASAVTGVRDERQRRAHGHRRPHGLRHARRRAFSSGASIGAFVRYSTMPESALIVFRMVVGAADRRRALRAPRDAGRGAPPRRLAEHPAHGRLQRQHHPAVLHSPCASPTSPSACSSCSRARSTWRWWRRGSRTSGRDRIVYPALAVALAGMATILVPGILGAERVSATGIACGVVVRRPVRRPSRWRQNGSRARSAAHDGPRRDGRRHGPPAAAGRCGRSSARGTSSPGTTSSPASRSASCAPPSRTCSTPKGCAACASSTLRSSGIWSR